MNKILTIVVPTYNMEKYLDKCLTSLIVPEPELMEQLEVLVVNDGSKDRSSEIAHSYQDRYPQTFRVIDKENGNYGSCVNRGLTEARGKYIKILDADDWFDADVLSKFITGMSIFDADMFLSDTVEVDNLGNVNNKFSHSDILDEKEIFTFDKLVKKGYTESRVMMHNIAYRTLLLRNIGYKQSEGIFYTDTEWVHKPMAYVERVCYFRGFLYNYLMGREGQSMSEEVRKSRMDDALIVFKTLLSNFIHYNGSISHKQFLFAFMKRAISAAYEWTIYSNYYDQSKLRQFDRFIKLNYNEIYKDMNSWVAYQNIGFPFIAYWRQGFYFFIREFFTSPKTSIRFYQHAIGRGIVKRGALLTFWNMIKQINRL